MPQAANVPPLQLAQALADHLLEREAIGAVPRFVTGIPEGILLGPLRSELEKRRRTVLGVDLSGDAPEDVMHAFDTWYMTLLRDTECRFGARLDEVFRELHRQTGRAIVLLVDRADRLAGDYHGHAIIGSLTTAFQAMSRTAWGQNFMLVLGGPHMSKLAWLPAGRGERTFPPTIVDMGDIRTSAENRR